MPTCLCRHHAGIRQTNRLRQRYLGSVLRQEIGFFDTTATTGILLQVRECPVTHAGISLLLDPVPGPDHLRPCNPQHVRSAMHDLADR